MGSLGNLVGSAVKVVLTPVAVAVDVVEVVTGEGEVDNTKDVVEGAVEDLGEARDNITEGDL